MDIIESMERLSLATFKNNLRFLFILACVGHAPFSTAGTKCSTYPAGTANTKFCDTYDNQTVPSFPGACDLNDSCHASSSSCNAKCLSSSEDGTTANPIYGGACTASGQSGFCTCNARNGANGFDSATCDLNPASPTTCVGPTAATAPLSNGHLSCAWQSGINYYFCAWSGGCSPSSSSASSEVVPQVVPGSSCSSTSPTILPQDKEFGCFTGHTAIDTPSGKSVIQSLKVGDSVWSFDLGSQRLALGTVTHLFFHPRKNYRILKIAGRESLEVTGNHPIYDLKKHDFVPASQLNSESSFITREKGVLNESFLQTQVDFGFIDDVYNIEVEPYHNYFAQGILVHNKIVDVSNPAPIHAGNLRGSYPNYLTDCQVICDAGFTQVGNTCVGLPSSSCPNWTAGGAWINPNRPLAANNCSGKVGLNGGFWVFPTFLDPWKACNACGSASNCATGCTGGGTNTDSYHSAPTSCRCPAQTSFEFAAMSASNQAICCAGPSVTACPTSCPPGETMDLSPRCCQPTVPVVPVVPVVPTSTCNASSGASGRQCSGTGQGTCCKGYECKLVGDQPLKLFPTCLDNDPTCIVPINWNPAYSSLPADPDSLLSSTTTVPPSSNFYFTGATTMCVKSVNTSQNPIAPLTANQILPPKSITPLMIKNEVVTWNGSYLVCNLQENDRHRVRSSASPLDSSTLFNPATNVSQGCACVRGPPINYEPVLLSIAEYKTYAYEIHSGSQRLNQLWANVMESLDSSPSLKKIVKKTVTEISHAVPSAWAIFGSCQGNPNGTGVNGAIQSGDPCDTYNGVYLSPVKGTCTPSAGVNAFACNPDRNLNGKSCNKSCLLSSDVNGVSDNPPGLGCNTAAGNPGTCTCGLFGSTNNYYPSSTCVPTACTLTASSCTAATPIFNSVTCACDPLPTAGTVTPLYLDTATHWVTTTALYDSTSSQAYGGPKIPTVNTDIVACLRECVPPAIRSTDPNLRGMCACPAPNDIFDPMSWTCKTCPKNSILVGGQCACPYNYEVFPPTSGSGAECLPKLPSAEFTRSTAGYPVCGTTTNPKYARLPVSYGFNISSAATHGEPSTSTALSTAPGPAEAAIQTILKRPTKNTTYLYSTLNTINGTDYPDYFYSQSPHCACTNHVYSPPGLVATPTTSKASFYGDTSDFINAFNSDGSPAKTYGMVSIAMDGVSDGRLGALATTGGSVCACPNINEIPTSVSGLSGPICAPGIAPRNRILAVFNPDVDDVLSKSLVMNRSSSSGYSEALNSASNAVVKSINLPNSQSSPKTLNAYSRHIWKCQLGYTLDLTLSPPACTISYLNQACDANSPLAATPSNLAFTNVINKKLACCMNSMPVGSKPTTGEVKFDCLETKATDQTDFNTLWASSDDPADGGQMNALLLTNGAGKPITGFFTLDGARCDEFSEFGGALTPGTVNPGIVSGQQMTVTNGWQPGPNSYPIPSSIGYGNMQTRLQAKGRKRVPLTSNAEARRCPILVRAAMVTTCPPVLPAPASATSPSSNAPQYTIEESPGGKRRCAAAATIQVHLRAEQLFQIAGDPPMITLDTIVDRKAAGNIPIDQIIRQKSGGKCLPGLINGSSGCHY